jgi:hypothetical protein
VPGVEREVDGGGGGEVRGPDAADAIETPATPRWSD